MKTLKLFTILIVLVSFSFAAHAKTLKVAFDADPVTLDPQEQMSGGILQMAHTVFDPLLRWTKDLKFESRLAEKWEQIDGKTIRFTLRKDVKFHSGNPLTAKDIEWSFNRLKTSDFKGLFTAFDKVKVIDDHTFEIITNKVYPLTLNLCTYIFAMDSKFYTGQDDKGREKSLIIKHGDSYASRNASGTGPFKVTYREQGVKTVYERFAGYWDKQSPGNVSKIVLTPIKEGPTRVAALLTGDVDFIAPVPPTDFNRIKSKSDIKLVTESGTRIITFQLNQERRAEFKNQKVRQAIVHAINNDGIVKKIMKGFGTVAAQQSPKTYVGHNPELKPRYNVEKAKQLMKEAGYENGFTVTMMAPNNRYVNDAKIAQAVVSMLAKINITVDLKTMPKAQYWPEYDKRSADIMMIGWHSDSEDSANFSEYLTMTPDKTAGYGLYNSGNYSNPQVDKLVLQTQSMVDVTARAEVLKKIEKLLYDDAAFVPLHWQDLAWASKGNYNIEPIVNALNFPYFGDLVVK